MAATVPRPVRQVKEHLLKLHGDKIKQVILYASQARGEATEDSDVDVRDFGFWSGVRTYGFDEHGQFNKRVLCALNHH